MARQGHTKNVGVSTLDIAGVAERGAKNLFDGYKSLGMARGCAWATS
jgi:hypothetical protein